MFTPQKLTIQPLDKNGKNLQPSSNSKSSAGLEVQFNPTEFTINKGVQIAEIAIPGLDSPILQFVRGQTETISLDLFFDTTEGGMEENAVAVTTKTDQFYELVKIDPTTHAPPVCRFSWGDTGFAGSNFQSPWDSQKRQNGMDCIVESVRQRFTLFNSKGVPLRATLTVALREYKALETQLKQLKLASPDHTDVHVVQRGETLSKLAHQYYANPAEWRRIADWNNISDPLALPPGTMLEIPPILLD